MAGGRLVLSRRAISRWGKVAEPQLNQIIIFFERESIAGEDQSDNRNLMSGNEPAQVEELFEEGLTEQAQSK
jgi:hypothetical protein